MKIEWILELNLNDQLSDRSSLKEYVLHYKKKKTVFQEIHNLTI